MQFPLQFASLTIPTGAGPGQQRITINDGQNGKIQVYDSNGNLVDSLGGSQGQFILYDSLGNMVISLASAAGTDEKTGFPFQPGITAYTATTSINLFANDGTWTASNGSKIVIETAAAASIFLTPSGGPWAAGFIDSTVGGGHPTLELFSPSDTVNAFTSNITMQGSSGASATTTITGAATIFNMAAICGFGNIVIDKVTITPSAANTPTSATVSYSTLKGSTSHAIVSAETSVPQACSVSANTITTSSAKIWLTRTDTTATVVHYMIWYT